MRRSEKQIGEREEGGVWRRIEIGHTKRVISLLEERKNRWD